MAKSVDDQVTEDVGEDEQKAEVPKPVSFKVYKDARIPVSSQLGSLWEERRRVSKRLRTNEGTERRWEEAMRYYYNDMNPVGPDGAPRRGPSTELVGNRTDEIENLIWSNAHALIPSIYAKNPDIEVTAKRTKDDEAEKLDEAEARARLYKRLINALMEKKTAPGVNMRTHMLRATMLTHLCDRAHLEVGYVRKEDSSEKALADLNELSTKYKEAKDTRELEELEGQMLALEEKISLLNPSGPYVKVRRPFDVLSDNEAYLPDFSDSNWVMIADYVRTSYLQAMYGEKDSETGDYMSIFRPTHVLAPDENTTGSRQYLDYNNLIQLKDAQTYDQFGFSSNNEYIRSRRTLVWYVWDRMSRRIMLYNDADWSWPIWVWDDIYQLPDFYNIVPMYYNMDPERLYSRSEVVYQLDMQDAVNECNSQAKRARRLSTDVFLYDDRLENKTVDSIIKGAQQGPTGIPVNTEGGNIDISKIAVPLMPPSAHVKEFYDKGPYMEALNRLSSVTSVLQGVEYKTNTTNKAIESYEGGQQMRLDEKVDTNERVIGEVGLKMLHMCVQFMDADTVVELTEMDEARVLWENMTPQEFDKRYAMTVVGGSALKPTSKMKKEEADAVVQRLGQFASASPVAFVIALRMYERAYDSIVVTAEDWRLLNETIKSALGAQGKSEGGQPPQEGNIQQPPSQPPQGDDGVQGVDVRQLLGALDKMPDEMRQRLAEGLMTGQPISQLLRQLVS